MTIRRFATSAGLSALLLAFNILSVRAAEGAAPLPFCCCAYNMWNCTYNDGRYWDHCDPTYDIGQIFTFVAETRCGELHDAP
jgi:hypothetical protein